MSIGLLESSNKSPLFAIPHRGLKHFLPEATLRALEESQVLVPYQNELQYCECCIQQPSANTAAWQVLAQLSLLHLSVATDTRVQQGWLYSIQVIQENLIRTSEVAITKVEINMRSWAAIQGLNWIQDAHKQNSYSITKKLI